MFFNFTRTNYLFIHTRYSVISVSVIFACFHNEDKNKYIMNLIQSVMVYVQMNNGFIQVERPEKLLPEWQENSCDNSLPIRGRL